MRTRRTAMGGIAVAVLGLASLIPAAGAAASFSPAERASAPGQLLARFRPATTPARIDAADRAMGAIPLESFHIVPKLQLVRLPAGLTAAEGSARFEARSDVLYAEPNFVSHIQRAPNDPGYPQQWNWNNTGQTGGSLDADVDGPQAWNVTTGASSVVVGIVDTGMQYTHPDLAANAFSNPAECNGIPGVDDDANGYVDDCHGIDAINHDSDPMDDFGHGTHLAGIIGAMTDNGRGVAGLDWHVTMLPCKSHDSAGNGTNASVIECLQYVQDWRARGLDVVATNNSYAGCPEACGFSRSMFDAIAANGRHGILYVAAAGNNFADNDTTPLYPADSFLPNVISVAATTSADSVAFFSDVGRHTVSLGAPGESVLSTWLGGSYASESGTSMAAPHVAALAALLAAHDPSLDARGIRNLILAGGDPVSSLASTTVSGRRMNAFGSLTCSNRDVFGPLRPLPTVRAGTQVVAALNIVCAKPAGALTVTITPGNLTLQLRDDGVLPDLVRNDGILSAIWRPAAGTYTLTYSNGKTDAVVVTP